MTLLIGGRTTDAEVLAGELDASTLWLPEAPPDADWGWAETLESWRSEHATGPTEASVVVAVWPEQHGHGGVAALDETEWTTRAEMPLARWVIALGVASGRVADVGSIVAVVETPAALDSAGWAPESSVADGVEVLVKSLARADGPARGVRANVVTTSRRFTPVPSVAPPVIGADTGIAAVAGVVRSVAAADSGSVTGAVVPADAGRAFR